MKKKLLVEMIHDEETNSYHSNGLLLKREFGELSPNGFPFNGAWVLRDSEKNYLGHHQYRNKIADKYLLDLVDYYIQDM